jgi:O-antigen ligase
LLAILGLYDSAWEGIVPAAEELAKQNKLDAIMVLGTALVILLLGWPKRWRRRCYLALPAAVVAIRILTPGVVGTIRALFLKFGQDNSVTGRTEDYQVAFRVFADNPILGVGMGNWAVARFLKDPGYAAGSPHNSYLLALVEGGIFCLLGFLALIWFTWSNLRFCERYVSHPDSPLYNLTWIVKSAKVSLLVA